MHVGLLHSQPRRFSQKGDCPSFPFTYSEIESSSPPQLSNLLATSHIRSGSRFLESCIKLEGQMRFESLGRGTFSVLNFRPVPHTKLVYPHLRIMKMFYEWNHWHFLQLLWLTTYHELNLKADRETQETWRRTKRIWWL